ncbi:type II toxin-antitoxin system VapC family toxin [Arhodomonas aquaeolei]|uniref:type II toxin-antitoxin system VapC family toxin n=1 Tax=Arhodomonas aquaeolei TaxID=2369 RepID=UPI0003769CB8|nr:PIN domain-containing protein [Arhodomonas aquaeolei]
MILLDLNVILDVVQQREPHYRPSAAVLERVIRGYDRACLPAHALTTVHYIVARYQNSAKANNAVDWMLRYMTVAPITHAVAIRARALDWPDFEDAMVAAVAEAAECTTIVTRNVRDFESSPVPALTPCEYLTSLDNNGIPKGA